MPVIASRDGVPAAHWQQIAERAGTFGLEIAKRPTLVQAVARTYLGGALSEQPYDPAKVKLDADRGITSVEPLTPLLDEAQTAVARYMDISRMHACMAAVVRPHGLDKSVFMATWRAFSSAAGRYIYPHQEVDRGRLPPPGGPDEGLKPALDGIARLIVAEFKSLTSQQYRAGPDGIHPIT